jgi:hypothetical protein
VVGVLVGVAGSNAEPPIGTSCIAAERVQLNDLSM